MTETLADVIEEARRVVDAASADRLALRALGGVAVALHAEGFLPRAVKRSYGDLDLATIAGQSDKVEQLLESLGYEPAMRFNALNKATRLRFHDARHDRQIDVFVGEFRMCHHIPLNERFYVDMPTLPLAELILSKLQIVMLTIKDIQDVVALMVSHDVSDHDVDAINGDWIARVLANDWGFWRTAKSSIESVTSQLAKMDLADHEQSRVANGLAYIWEIVEASPKSRKWRIRARLGERVKWYDEPEEIEQTP